MQHITAPARHIERLVSGAVAPPRVSRPQLKPSRNLTTITGDAGISQQVHHAQRRQKPTSTSQLVNQSLKLNPRHAELLQLTVSQVRFKNVKYLVFLIKRKYSLTVLELGCGEAEIESNDIWGAYRSLLLTN